MVPLISQFEEEGVLVAASYWKHLQKL